jgi:acyl-CoA dehydrogenase
VYDYAYGLTDTELALKEAVRHFAQSALRPVAAEMERRGEFTWDVFREMGALGLFKILLPESEGGMGLGARAFVLVMEEICRVSASLGVLFQGHSCMLQAFAAAASGAQRGSYLEKLSNAELLLGACLTEPQSGSDLASLRTSARLEGGEWVLNGHKIFISNGGKADLYIVAARTEEAPRHHGISLLLVPANTPGLRIGRIEKKMGLLASPTSEVLFENCRVPATSLLGQRGMGFAVVEKSLNTARLGAAAAAIGLSQTALDESLKYAREREQFGHSIYDFQAVQFMVVEMATRLHLSRLVTYHAASKVDAGLDSSREVAMAKYTATDYAMQTTTDAIQVFGGAGYMQDYPVERLMRDAKVWQIVDGTNQIQRVIVGRSLAKHAD